MGTADSNNDRLDIVDHLISFKVDINSIAEEGFTALMFAAKRGNIEIVKILLAQNAQIDIKNIYGKNALQGTSENLAHSLERLKKIPYEDEQREQIIKINENRAKIIKLLEEENQRREILHFYNKEKLKAIKKYLCPQGIAETVNGYLTQEFVSLSKIIELYRLNAIEEHLKVLALSAIVNEYLINDIV